MSYHLIYVMSHDKRSETILYLIICRFGYGFTQTNLSYQRDYIKDRIYIVLKYSCLLSSKSVPCLVFASLVDYIFPS